MKKVKVGSLVTLRDGEDAIWWEVLEIAGFWLKIKEAGTNFTPDVTDISLVKKVK